MTEADLMTSSEKKKPLSTKNDVSKGSDHVLAFAKDGVASEVSSSAAWLNMDTDGERSTKNRDDEQHAS